MNIRIKELAAQAGYKDLPTVRLAFDGFDKEKFAELIVKECVSLIRYMGNPTYINDSDWEVSRMDAMRVIQKHFGVE